jgi:hypothetical protein
LARDPTASSEVAEAYLEALVVWLGETHPAAPEDARVEAAEEAVLALIRKPQSYDPGRQTLEVYLRMSARGDLLNLLRKLRRHTKGRRSLHRVELSPDAGKYLGCDGDPSFRLRLAEERESVRSAIPDSVRRQLGETDLRALELMLLKVRPNAVYAELFGLTDLPRPERDREVKRRKDRLKKMLERAREKP